MEQESYLAMACKQAWRLFLNKYWLFLGVWCVGLVLIAVACITIVGMLVAPALYAGMLHTFIKASKGGAVQFSDLFSCLPRFWTFFVAFLWKYLAIVIGLVCFIIPGIYLMVRWYFVTPTLIETGCGVREAFNRSTCLVKQSPWEIFGVVTLLGIFGILIECASLVNLFLGMIIPIVYIQYYLIFSRMASEVCDVQVIDA